MSSHTEARKPILVATRHFLPAVEARIHERFAAHYNDTGRAFTQDELLYAAESADALLVSPADTLDDRFFEKLSQSVKVIATFSVGYDHIDVAAAAKRGVPIANTPDVLTDATAEIALLLMLGAARRATEGQEIVRSGLWPQRKPIDLLGWQLSGKTLGIFGMGRIGQAVAQRARAFGMRIHYCNRQPLAPDSEHGAVYHSDPEDLLRVSEFLSLHAPSTPQTRDVLNKRRIELLPQGAIVVNTARGNLVNDEDLIEALKTGRIAAAGLDVFEGEPNVNPGYQTLPNVFLLPHIGSATVETRTAMGMLALDNIEAVLGNKSAPTLIRG
jgi:lactate dehydrogenase-like 2-hydroxyacid dehydrogenase